MKKTTASRKSSRQGDGSQLASPAEQAFESIASEQLSDSRISQGKMFGSAGLKINGKVYAMIVKGRLVVKLPRERVDALVATGEGEYFDPGHGRLMKEWTAVEKGTEAKWRKLVDEAREFVGSKGIRDD